MKVKINLSFLILFLILLLSTSGFSQGLVNNFFVETDLQQCLRDISAQTGVTIVPDSSVVGTVSIELKDVPLPQALRMILHPLGYTFKKVDNYYLVGGCNPRSSSFAFLSRTEKITLKHHRVSDVRRVFPAFYAPYLEIDEPRNRITITAPDDIIKRFKKDIALIDAPSKQVLIEVTVAELSTEETKNLGIDWEWMWQKGGGESSSSKSSIQFKDLAGDLAYETTGALTKKALLSIKALAGQGKARIWANPKILTMDTREAKITIGKETYVSLVSGTVGREYTRLESVNTGVVLKITPFVSGDNSLIIEAEPELSEVVGSTIDGKLPVVSKRAARTTVQTRDGETVSIGGLIQEGEENRVVRVPILGKIPLLGLLFRSTKKVKTETELIIFITPHIIATPSDLTTARRRPHIGYLSGR